LAAAAAAEAVTSVVVTTGPNPTEVLDTGTSRVFTAQYLPQSVVLPHVDVVVSHGGAGTTLGALTHGLPHVVFPQFRFGSQMRNAQRVDELGIGIHFTQLDIHALAMSIRTAVTDRSFAVRAERMCADLLELPSPKDVLAKLVNDFA
jgi:UDP:flavonoid glycosyltransferase YjiC (YdhE family)